MIIKNCEVETNTIYGLNEDFGSSPKEYLILNIKVPGGKVIYEIPISKEIADNIEAASTLFK